LSSEAVTLIWLDSLGRCVVEPVNEAWKRAVAIVAHPDDLEHGAASAVARWTSQGKDVSYVLATSGEAGIAGMPPEKTGPLREEEQRRSAAVVGVNHVEFLGHPDGAVEYGLKLRRDLTGALRRLRPEVVIGMNFDLTWGEGGSVNHADHRAVGLATHDACRDSANEWVFSDLGAPWAGIKATYIGGMEDTTHYVDVTDTIGLGIASLREHRAYIEGLGTDFDPDEFLRNIGGYGGMVAGCEFAVLFQAFNAS
jgi:LmbE family N-acetylglucosaminyl deacetylase